MHHAGLQRVRLHTQDAPAFHLQGTVAAHRELKVHRLALAIGRAISRDEDGLDGALGAGGGLGIFQDQHAGVHEQAAVAVLGQSFFY